MYKLSIITINLNNAQGLRKTIESVVNQTYNDFEYIIIDGGSSDGSVELIKEYADKITYWVSEPDNGIYNAMNKGILKATGEYCLFLNSGDWLVDNILSLVFNNAINVDILYGNIIKQYSIKESEIFKGCAKEYLTLLDFMFDKISHQAAFIKRNLFLIFGFFDERFKIASDVLFFARVIIKENVTYKYIDLNITNFDPYGIGNFGEDEKKIALETLFSKRILDDYYYLKELKDQVLNLKIELKRYKHRFSIIDRLYTRTKKFLIRLFTNINA
jgi:glycosyltransferase involved in cell wall biosynthesis